MLTGRRILNLSALLILAFFCFGLVRLFALRFSAGDIFPPYSSLRADPLGVEIFYESLRALPDYEVTRHERDFDRLPSGARVTLFILGAKQMLPSTKEQSALDHFVQKGGRLVLTFFPSFENPTPTTTPTRAAELTPKIIALKNLADHWQVKIEMDRNVDEDEPAGAKSALPPEAELSWHSGIFFTPTNGEWHTIYARGKHPVIIERALGAGSIVFAGDSYFVSNEALLVERHPALLAWLVGPNRRIIFDESHLNIRKSPGVVSLLRKYRLGGFVLALLFLLSLWLWKNAAASLSSRQPNERTNIIVSGRDSFSGFVSLLRRGIAPAQLIEICVGEWRKSQPLAAVLPATESENNPILAYNRLSELIGSKKWKKPTSN